jgi:hypothetical protein
MYGFKNIENNKYFNWYCNIIDKRINTPLNEMVYGEKHHILPKCMHGTDDIDNIIKVSAKEHFVLHLLLTKFVNGSFRDKILFAFFAMSMKNNNGGTYERYCSSRVYESLKIELSQIISEQMKKMHSNPEYKTSHSKKIKESWSGGKRQSQLEYMRENSPFKDKSVHEKTIVSRTKNGTNVYITNNPMHDPIKKQKKVEQTTGLNHYIHRTRKYFYRVRGTSIWYEINFEGGLESALKLLNFPVTTFMAMLNGYIPNRGKMSNYEVKRVNLENNTNT